MYQDIHINSSWLTSFDGLGAWMEQMEVYTKWSFDKKINK